MTEAEWLTSDDSFPMLEAVREVASERKVRLFTCAWSRLGWGHLSDGPLRRAIEISERFADGRVTSEEREQAFREAFAEVRDIRSQLLADSGEVAMHAHPRMRAAFHAAYTVGSRCGEVEIHLRHRSDWLAPSDRANLLRDVFGNPFRPVSFSPDWRTDTVLSLARTMYDGRDFSAMPILADALQDAGCEEVSVLDHCRSERPHVRGCWVVDLVLGKG